MSYLQPCGVVLYGAYTRIQFCCFIYQTREFVSATIDYQPTCLFITWGRTLVQPSPLGQAEPLSSLATTVMGAYYREGYGCVTRNKKATYNCIRVAPPENPQRPERMCKRLHFVVCYNNGADINWKPKGLSRTLM